MIYRLSVVLLTYVFLCFSPLSAATYTVMNNADAGGGSLRQAITLANGNPGADIIEFNIGGAGVKTITLLSDLPIISDQLFIDGSSEPAYAGAPLIEINANGQGNGLEINAAGASSHIHALIINNATLDANASGIYVNGDDVTITGCYIGTDETGTIAVPNTNAGIYAFFADGLKVGGTGANEGNLISGNGAYGMFLWFADNSELFGNKVGIDITGTTSLPNSQGIYVWHCRGATIGGATAAHRNLVSGNTNQGLYLSSGGSSNIYGNYVGTDITGTLAIPNSVGIHISVDSTNIGGIIPGQGNLISGNTQNGITIFASFTFDNTVRGNLIGTDVTGMLALPNQGNGINFHAATRTTIGGLIPEARNIISGNGGTGVSVFDTDSTYIYGNYIGTNITGTAPLPNVRSGISMFVTYHTFVGNATPAGANVISGNASDGISMTGSNTLDDSTIVQYNFIGTDPTGLLNLANGRYGVSINSNTLANKVGGTGPGQGNIIANNLQGGISVQGAMTLRNSLFRNSIYDHPAPGIQLNAGNNSQEAPALTGYAAGAGTTTIFGSFNSAPNTTYRLEFFSSNTSGQGKTFIGTTNITTDATGAYLLNEVVAATITAAEPVITATATDPVGNTSAFGLETVLDVELNSFSVEELPKRSALLNWEISEQEQDLYFEVEHKLAGGEFQKIGEQRKYKPMLQGRIYEFTTQDLSLGTHQFRLRQMEKGGLISYSKSVELSISQDAAVQYSLENPMSSTSNLRINLQQAEIVRIYITDIKGKKAVTLYEGKINPGIQREIPMIGVKDLSTGIYMLHIQGQSFSINKKVLLNSSF